MHRSRLELGTDGDAMHPWPGGRGAHRSDVDPPAACTDMGAVRQRRSTGGRAYSVLWTHRGGEKGCQNLSGV